VVYVHAGQQVIADYARGAAAAAPSFRYVYGSYVDEPLLRHAGTGTTLPTSGTAALYYHRNQQYSIVGLSDAAGTLVERYAYTAYGELTILAPDRTARATSSFQNRYTYTGREWDPTLRLYYFRARWLEPKAGRFIGRDPLGYVDGMGLYGAYLGLDGTDPTGEIKRVNPCLFRGRKKCSSQNPVGIRFDFDIENPNVLEDSKRDNFGYVIQRVEINCEQCDCEVEGCEELQGGWLLGRINIPRFRFRCGANCKKGEPVVYYEAWKIGGEIGGKLGLADLHTIIATPLKCTKRTITAKTRFTKKINMVHWDKNPNKEFGDGLCRASPGYAFHYTGRGVPPEFELPLFKPNWNRNEPEMNYQTSLESDCCSGSNVGPFKITDLDNGKDEIIQ
jgi:RHS repeat-associated protein